MVARCPVLGQVQQAATTTVLACVREEEVGEGGKRSGDARDCLQVRRKKYGVATFYGTDF